LSIRELARHLNLSIGTVSRALNGKSDVNADTRERVMKAAVQLGYSPNQSGRSLRQGATGMVALLIPTNDKLEFTGTIFMRVLEGLRAFVHSRGLDVMVLLSGDGEEAYSYLRRTVERRLVDGLIISQTQRKDPRIDYLLEKRIPFVAFGRSRSGGTHSWVDLDFEGVAEAGVERLVTAGHRRIGAAVSTGEINYSYVFRDAFRRAMRKHGLPVDPKVVFHVANGEEGGYELGNRLIAMAMAERPTGIVIINQSMVVGLYSRLAEAGLVPGRDLSIIGFQEEPTARFLTPQVTCYRSDLDGLGERLGEALLARMAAAGDKAVTPIQEIWPMRLVPGESDGPPVGRPVLRSRA
jgi:DNA-binding LacI/PurR family transcriptional regulator